MKRGQEHFIKTIDGKYMTIRKHHKLKLCAISHQSVATAPSVKILYRRTNTRQMAFVFRYDKAKYFLAVDGKNLKLQMCSGCSHLLRCPRCKECGLCPQCLRRKECSECADLKSLQLTKEKLCPECSHLTTCPECPQETTCAHCRRDDPDKHWFEKVNVGSGDHFTLRSVASSSLCLMLSGKSSTFTCAEDNGQEFTRLTFVEKRTSIEQETQTTNEPAASTI